MLFFWQEVNQVLLSNASASALSFVRQNKLFICDKSKPALSREAHVARYQELLSDCSHTLSLRRPLLNLPVRLTALCLLSARINHCAHFLLSPRQHLFFFFQATLYLCPASSLGCQSPSGWISLSGSTCLSPRSSVCDVLMDLQRKGSDE